MTHFHEGNATDRYCPNCGASEDWYNCSDCNEATCKHCCDKVNSTICALCGTLRGEIEAKEETP